MKYIGLLAFLLALNWTWCLSHDDKDISLETHTSVQKTMIDLITESVSKKRPDSIEVTFHRIWTESLNANRLKATFQYKILNRYGSGDEDSETISGHAIINRVQDNSWSVDTVTTTNADMSFKSGTLIVPGAN